MTERRTSCKVLRLDMKQRIKVSLTWMTVLLVLLIAVSAAMSLWALHHVQKQVAHSMAAQSVLDKGVLLTAYLGGQVPDRAAEREDRNWAFFSRQVASLYAVEDGLQYVSVSHNGVTLYQKHTRTLDGRSPAIDWLDETIASSEVTMIPKLLHMGDETVPVVVFSLSLPGPDEHTNILEVALRKDTVEREEVVAAGAVQAMFKLALTTIIIAFAVCISLVAWMMSREHQRETRRREEEHLAFSGVMANGIVHDFRNPMSSLQLDIQMLGKEVDKGAACRPERLRELSGRIQQTMTRMEKVFREFLFLSRPSTEDTEIVHVEAFLGECIEILKPRFERKRLRVELRNSAGLVASRVYTESLRRGIINLLINAEQFSPENATIFIDISVVGPRVMIDIQDEGPGVPRKDRKVIFNMFVSSRPGGTGLGLFLARTAIERSGGDIRLLDRGPGACFRMTLPLSREEP
ncbi:MAG: HAMP domain-containing histidine kinase [Spartobacteria bacterium]|nr:HAMP domain-containing histidine kinase [Spartobacteria bacterium]